MAWWSREPGLSSEPKKSVPKGVWHKCEACGESLLEKDLNENLRVCPTCGIYRGRAVIVTDED